jgi:hypothetical protein
MPPIAALTPMPAIAPLDSPLECCDVPVPPEDGPEDVWEGDMVGVATFQPASPTALMVEEVLTVMEVCSKAPETWPRYVRTWPDVRADMQVPTTSPGSPFWRSYPLKRVLA